MNKQTIAVVLLLAVVGYRYFSQDKTPEPAPTPDTPAPVINATLADKLKVVFPANSETPGLLGAVFESLAERFEADGTRTSPVVKTQADAAAILSAAGRISIQGHTVPAEFSAVAGQHFAELGRQPTAMTPEERAKIVRLMREFGEALSSI
jgi:hypothetical protein